MVRVGLNKNGSIHTPKENKPKLDDAMMRMKRKKKHMIADMKHKKHHRKDKQKDKDKNQKRLDQKMLERKMLEQKMMELEKEHMDDDDSDDDNDESMDDDSYDMDSSSNSSDSSSDSSDDECSNPFGKGIDKQIDKEIKPEKALDIPNKKVNLNMKIVSKDYVDICTQIHMLSKSLKVSKSDKKIIDSIIYYYIKYFLYSCCITKKPVFKWLEEFRDKIHIY